MEFEAAKVTIQNVLDHVGTKAGAHRCRLFSVYSHAIVIEHEWARNAQTKLDYQHIAKASIPTIVKSAEEGVMMNMQTLPDSCVDFEFFKSHGIEALLMIPIRDPQQGTTIGLLSFDSFEARQWTEKDILFLELARDIVTAVLSQPDTFLNLTRETACLDQQQIARLLTVEQHAIVERIASLFEPLRRLSLIEDLWVSVGKTAFMDKISRFVLDDQPILLALPAFPMKSPDVENKVTGKTPDLGEALALANLQSFAIEVGQFYAPGCKILIISDGRVFNDLYPVPDTIVSQYTSLIRSLGAGPLQFIGLDEIFPSREHHSKRDMMVFFHGADLDSVAKKLKEDSHFHQIYIAFKLLLRKDLGNNRTQAAETAKLMMLRNESYSHLIEILFPHHIRLSIHDHSGAHKIGVHLVGQSVITPWHGVAVKLKDGTWAIMRKHTAQEMGCVLEDALSPHNRQEIALHYLKGLNLSKVKSLLFYREM